MPTLPPPSESARAIAARTFFCNLTSTQQAVDVYDRLESCEDADADPSEVAGFPVLSSFENDPMDRVFTLMEGLALDVDNALQLVSQSEGARILKAMVEAFEGGHWAPSTQRLEALRAAREYCARIQPAAVEAAPAPREG